VLRRVHAQPRAGACNDRVTANRDGEGGARKQRDRRSRWRTPFAVREAAARTPPNAPGDRAPDRANRPERRAVGTAASGIITATPHRGSASNAWPSPPGQVGVRRVRRSSTQHLHRLSYVRGQADHVAAPMSRVNCSNAPHRSNRGADIAASCRLCYLRAVRRLPWDPANDDGPRTGDSVCASHVAAVSPARRLPPRRPLGSAAQPPGGLAPRGSACGGRSAFLTRCSLSRAGLPGARVLLRMDAMPAGEVDV
jgi:hypothetical protein